MRKQLRTLVEFALRRLPVSRGVYAERDGFKQRVQRMELDRLEELDVARFLKQADTACRNRLFDAFADVRLSEYLYVEMDDVRFLVNSNDQSISRALFIAGTSDFSKFERAMSLLGRRAGAGHGIDLLVDVGANIGSICIPAVLREHASRAIAIEPQPTNCRLLRANIAVNGLHERIQVFERAASDRDGALLSMELSEKNWGDHRISLSRAPGRYGEAERPRIDVSSIKLDSLEHIDPRARFLLWMDIQGYEGHALSGAKQLLTHKPPLVLEFWPYGMLRADSFSSFVRSTAHYHGFYDLTKPTGSLRPIIELANLFDELGADGNSTDILVI